ncbi:uncharacterized protein [Atheta coriaria]|uniref:uncharacterized protein isoform X2 n=1 Tax=Dalotia coriaria TaxID=877792 RepID=UPI0031F37ADC
MWQIISCYFFKLSFLSKIIIVGGLISMASTPTSGLKWVRVNLPQYRRPGELAQLQCDYDLGNDTLYAVKWYKENEEFYRFVLKERPQANSYKVEGVHVDQESGLEICRPSNRWIISLRSFGGGAVLRFGTERSPLGCRVVSAQRPEDNGRRVAISDRRRDQPELHFRKKLSGVAAALVHKRSTDIKLEHVDQVSGYRAPPRVGDDRFGNALQSQQSALSGWPHANQVHRVGVAFTLAG